MSSPFRVIQVNGLAFRAQLFRMNEKYVLWVAESVDEIYTLSFDRALSADIYQPDSKEALAKAILLYLDDEDVHSIEIGNFAPEDAMGFLSWLQNSLTL